MPSLNEIMCSQTTLVISVNGGASAGSYRVRNGIGIPPGITGRFNFDFISENFTISPVRFQPRAMAGNEMQIRDASIALFQTQRLLTQLNGMNFNQGVEQDAIILDDGSLHDLRRGRNSTYSPDRTRTPTQPRPAGRSFVGYFHTHPSAIVMRPPTPAADWNEVPGVGVPGTGSVLHFMIECNKKIWGLLHNRHAFIVGKIHNSQFRRMPPTVVGFGHCWRLS